MHERGRYIANPLRIFEKILSFVVIPASGILIPLLFEVFEGRPFREQAGLYITTVALSYLVWFGCRQMFITLRFSESFNLTYPKYVLYYSIFLVVYSFSLVFYTFKAINYFSGTQSKPFHIAGLTTLLTIFISAVYEIILLLEEKNAQQLNNIDLERAKTLTELNSLKSRIEPHFLFNLLKEI